MVIKKATILHGEDSHQSDRDYHSVTDFTQTTMTYNKFSTLELAKNIKVIHNTK